jgi:diguanylate cyclase (GGDEF)-like protein
MKPDNKPRLLLVDDQAVNIQILYQILGSDHELIMATSGAQALTVCVNQKPDLILLDIMMPEMDGLEVCRRLKSDPQTRDIPVIFVTAQSDPSEEAAGLELGAVDFISRPINAPVVLARVRTHLTLKYQSDLLRSMAFLDGLTGIANRRNFDETLAIEWQDCKRNKYPLSLILMDIDHFKRFNDHYGHQAGDTCLLSMATAMQECMGRAHDLVARYGGEEFVCILPNCSLVGASQLAEKIRTKVQALPIPHAASPTVTLSAGVSCVVPDEDLSWGLLVSLADQQLYAAKMAGRNRIHSAMLQVSANAE